MNYKFLIIFILVINSITLNGKDIKRVSGLLTMSDNRNVQIEGLISQLCSDSNKTNEPTLYVKNPDYRSDQIIWEQIKLSFFRTRIDSIFYWTSEFIKNFPKSKFVNDALNLLILITDLKDDTIGLKAYADVVYNYENKNYEQAKSVCQELIKKNTNIAEYGYLMLSTIYKTQNQINLAIASLTEFSNKFPKSKLIPQVHYELGVIYLNFLGDTLKARDVFENLIFNFPTAPESYWARALLANLKVSTKHTQ
ncbi:MAG: tetratricopeptide repeat protein [candidate division WOR-3 bacterium]